MRSLGLRVWEFRGLDFGGLWLEGLGLRLRVWELRD